MMNLIPEGIEQEKTMAEDQEEDRFQVCIFYRGMVTFSCRSNDQTAAGAGDAGER